MATRCERGRRAVTVAFQGNKTAADYAALAALAEDLGFDGVSVYADLGFQPAIFPLLTMAGRTRRVRLGPAALNASLLHPVEIAGQIAALDAASDGRAYLGLARGAWLDAVGAEDARPLARMREAIAVIRRLLADDRSGFKGEFFRLARAAPAISLEVETSWLPHRPRARPGSGWSIGRTTSSCRPARR